MLILYYISSKKHFYQDDSKSKLFKVWQVKTEK